MIYIIISSIIITYNIYYCILLLCWIPDKHELTSVIHVIWFNSPSHSGAPCRFSGRFEDANFGMKAKMKIYFTLCWRTKMWRTQFSHILNNENHKLPYSLKMKITFPKLLKTKIWRSPSKLWRRWRPNRVQEPCFLLFFYGNKFIHLSYLAANITQSSQANIEQIDNSQQKVPRPCLMWEHIQLQTQQLLWSVKTIPGSFCSAG